MQTVKKTFQLTVNGEKKVVKVDPDTPLLYVLRNQLALYGPKYGCGLGQCGACMVMIDNEPIMSCMSTVKAAEGKEVTTLAGLVKKDGSLHPIQQAFIDEQAAQCGYCTNGMILSAFALLKRNPSPNENEIRQALQINLCRCGSQSRVLRAIHRAIEML